MCRPPKRRTVVVVGSSGVVLLERVRRMPAWRLDAVLATAFVCTGLLTTGRTEPGYEPRDALAVVLVLAATVPYYASHRWRCSWCR
jgi:hypothetical protein